MRWNVVNSFDSVSICFGLFWHWHAWHDTMPYPRSGMDAGGYTVHALDGHEAPENGKSKAGLREERDRR